MATAKNDHISRGEAKGRVTLTLEVGTRSVAWLEVEATRPSSRERDVESNEVDAPQTHPRVVVANDRQTSSLSHLSTAPLLQYHLHLIPGA